MFDQRPKNGRLEELAKTPTFEDKKQDSLAKLVAYLSNQVGFTVTEGQATEYAVGKAVLNFEMLEKVSSGTS